MYSDIVKWNLWSFHMLLSTYTHIIFDGFFLKCNGIAQDFSQQFGWHYTVYNGTAHPWHIEQLGWKRSNSDGLALYVYPIYKHDDDQVSGVRFIVSFIGRQCPDRKVYGANMGPTWGRQDPVETHVGPMNFAIWVLSEGPRKRGWYSPSSYQVPSWYKIRPILHNHCIN